ncbi:MAG: acyl-CoA dehydrogenase family protein [Nitrososphaerales archaeon]|nr:acyl-CoA dehydrogenase family protein [Nitrososphaerales archaeon]
MSDFPEVHVKPEYAEVKKWARDFAAREILPIAEKIDRSDEYPMQLAKKMGEYGLLGLNTPQEYGGLGLDLMGSVVVGKEIAKASLSASFIMGVQNGLAGNVLTKFGSKEQKAKYLPRLAKGEIICSYGLTEPGAGSDAAGLTTKATKAGDSYVINGSKMFITQGAVADVLVFFARTGKPEDGAAGITAFVVEKGTPGFRVGQRLEVMGARGTGTAELVFENCKIPATNLIGHEGDGFLIAMAILAESRIGAAAAAVGIAEAAMEQVLPYVKKRNIFDRPLSKYEAIRFMIADMATRTRAAWLLTLHAATLRDSGGEFMKEAAMAKYFASEAAVWVCERAIQIHGGYGVSKLLPVERYLRDAKILDIVEGTSEVQRWILSRELLDTQ